VTDHLKIEKQSGKIKPKYLMKTQPTLSIILITASALCGARAGEYLGYQIQDIKSKIRADQAELIKIEKMKGDVQADGVLNFLSGSKGDSTDLKHAGNLGLTTLTGNESRLKKEIKSLNKQLNGLMKDLAGTASKGYSPYAKSTCNVKNSCKVKPTCKVKPICKVKPTIEKPRIEKPSMR